MTFNDILIGIVPVCIICAMILSFIGCVCYLVYNFIVVPIKWFTRRRRNNKAWDKVKKENPEAYYRTWKD